MIRSAIRAFRSYFRRDWDLESLVNVIDHDRPITPEILLHLEKMYRILFWIITSFGFGCRFGLAGYIGPIGLSLFIVWYPEYGPLRQDKRFYILIICAMLGGFLVGPFLHWYFNAYLGINVINGAIMGSFAALVEWEEVRFCFLSLSGVLLLENPLQVELVFVAGLFFSVKPNFEVCNFIVWFMAYAAVYSRLLVQRIRGGDGDFVHHAITFFTDAPAVCFHMVNLVFWGAISELEWDWDDVINFLWRCIFLFR